MARSIHISIFGLVCLLVLSFARPAPDTYRHFDVAVYARVYEVQQMADLNWLRDRFDVMNRFVKIDKVYLETHRDTIIADEATIIQAKEFFESRGIRTSGGITLTVNERNRFETFCYSNQEHREKVRDIMIYTTRHFDEVILDDFFFTSCKSEEEVRAKGNRSWTEYRLELLDEATRELIIEPAKAANPDVSIIVKYPNWYEHFQGLGFNLETQPDLFDKLYTGTETRDAVYSNQHLQQYHGYQIFRYFENLKPGGNAGGWVDTGGMRYMDRYAEQLWLTLFAKAPEITLFDFRQLQRPIRETDRAAWQGIHTSFDFDEMVAPYRQDDWSLEPGLTIALAAGYTFEKVDRFLGELGEPIGVTSYRPHHATGEDFLHNFIGMAGIPIDLRPGFPADAQTIFLTESAKYDMNIVGKIKSQLMAGKTVVITSGLLHALQGKGIEDIVELEYTSRKALVKEFLVGWGPPVEAEEEILIPQIQYLTNDSWEQVSALDNGLGWPILHDADYADGSLYVLTIPDNFGELKSYPPAVWNRIKQTLMRDLYVRVESPGQVSLFVYDNDTFIVESFLDETVEVRIVIDDRIGTLRDLVSGEDLEVEAPPERPAFFGPSPNTGKVFVTTEVKPHSYRVFKGL